MNARRPTFVREDQLPDSALLESATAVIRGDSVWAHASGWAQLSGLKRSVSCVLPCRDHAPVLTKLIPLLSDALTECGHPWELLMIDHGSRDGTAAVMRSWTEFPGFRSVQLGPRASRADGVLAGLMLSRGDAVVLYNADVVHSPALIPQMIGRWECDAWMVLATAGERDRPSELTSWDEAQAVRRVLHASAELPPYLFDLSVLDRRLLDRLLSA